MRRSVVSAGLVIVMAAALSACDEDTVAPEDGGQVTLSVAVPGAMSTNASGEAGVGPSLDIRQTDGTSELVITRVAMVLREIELERANENCPEDASGEEDDACEEFEVDPMLLELPLDGSVDQVVQVTVPADTYDEIEFEIHKPEDDTDEGQAFIQEHPEFADTSIRVEGTFDGEEFVFVQDLNEDQEIELVDPLVVEEGAEPIDLTLRIDVRTWFTRADGTLVDPATANDGGENENLVEENIETSIEAFDED